MSHTRGNGDEDNQHQLQEQEHHHHNEHNDFVFNGLTFFISGDASAPQTTRLLLAHGGLVDQHPTSIVTHVVSDHIPLTVRPQWVGKHLVCTRWVSNSIAAGKLLRDPDSGYVGTPTIANWTSLARSVNQRAMMYSWASGGPAGKVATREVGDEAGPKTGNMSRVDDTNRKLRTARKDKGKSNHEITESNEAPVEMYDGNNDNDDDDDDEGDDASENNDYDVSRSILLGDEQRGDDNDSDEVQADIITEATYGVQELSTGRDSTWDGINTDPQANPASRKGTARAIPRTEDPTFLPTFFQNSRLHHLSTWKQELFQLVRDSLPNNKPLDDPALTNTNSVFALAARGPKHGDSAKDDPQSSEQTAHAIWFHIDMDCFFATASLLSHPELRDKPVAVCHVKSGYKDSTSEIASCNYPARKFGIKNGTFLKNALAKCRHLKVVSYDFKLYRGISFKFYNSIIDMVRRLEGYLMPCSLDEVYIQIPVKNLLNLSYKDGEFIMTKSIDSSATDDTDVMASSKEFAKFIRRRIENITGGCTCSIGFGVNRFISRVATMKAKPNGSYGIPTRDLRRELIKINSLDSLVGLGWSNVRKLKENSILTMEDIYVQPKSRLMNLLGTKLGTQIYQFLRGVDNRVDNSWKQLVSTVSINVNWGIRLADEPAMIQFAANLTEELKKKLLVTRNEWAQRITITLKVHEPGTDEYKFLGCGICYDCSFSYDLNGKDWSFIRKCIIYSSRKAANTPKGTGSPNCLRGYNCSLSKLIPVLQPHKPQPQRRSPPPISYIQPEPQNPKPSTSSSRPKARPAPKIPTPTITLTQGEFITTRDHAGIDPNETPLGVARAGTITLRTLDTSARTDLDWDWDWQPRRMNIFRNSSKSHDEYHTQDAIQMSFIHDSQVSVELDNRRVDRRKEVEHHIQEAFLNARKELGLPVMK